MRDLWPIAPAYADDDNREHTMAGDLGWVVCADCSGTGSRGRGEAARTCEPCEGSGEVRAEREPTRH